MAANVAFSGTHMGSEYTPEEQEFMLAMERYRRVRRRPFPTCCEILEVLHSLGWRRVAETQPLPKPAGRGDRG